MRAMLLIAVLAGCGDGGDRDKDGVIDAEDCAPDDPAYSAITTWQQDADGDGYGMPFTSCEPPEDAVEQGGDCADGYPDRHPGVDEHCDGIDEDCDGKMDNNAVDAVRWSKDSDGDGYGSVTGVVTGCDAPLGYISRGGDCDDKDIAIFPGADEYCDDVDEDCDGVVDNDPLGAPTWRRDADEDGYGSDVVTLAACKQPAGYLALGGDCDDADDLLNPGATEYCNGFDDDCDGLLDKADPDEAGDATWYQDVDGDLWGVAEVTTTACAWPTGFARRDGDCDDAVSTVNPGETEVCLNGADDDCDGDAPACVEEGEADIDEGAWATWSGTVSGGLLGVSRGLGAIADWDGDGVSEIALGAQGGASGAGAVYVLTGGAAGGPVSGGLELAGATAGDAVGLSLAAVGDGVLIGAPGVNSLAGAAYWVSGPLSAGGKLSTLATATLSGPAAGQAGYAVASAGDQDDDGWDDLLVGANTYASGAGRVYLVPGDVTGNVALDTAATATVTGEGAEGLGWSVSSGDLSGDGVAELVMGAPVSDGDTAGKTWIFEGPVSGELTVGDGIVVTGDQAGAQSSMAIEASGDFDGDGYRDLAVGAFAWDDATADSGRVSVVFGPIAADMTLTKADATFDGESGAYCGYSIAAVGSPTGDGLDDLAIGCALGWVPANQRGVAALIAGGFAAGSYPITHTGQRWAGVADSDTVGAGVGAAGDQDGDGVDDWLVGAPYNSDAGANAGKVMIFLGASAF